MNNIKTVLLTISIPLATFNYAYSQSSYGREVIIIVPQNDNILAPLPLYTPNWNGLKSNLDQRSYNYEQELRRQRAIFDAMTPEEQRAYLAQIRANQQAEENNRVRQMKFEQRTQRIAYIIVGIGALAYFLLND